MVARISEKLSTIYPRSPYSISLHLERFCGKDSPTPCIYKNRSCRRIIQIGDNYIPYKILIQSEGWHPILRVKVFTGEETLAEETLNIIKEIYRVDFDYKKFLEKSRLLEPVYVIAMKHKGLRPTKMPNIYEALIDSIIEQNISLQLAMKIKAAFVRSYGEMINIYGEEYYSFPISERIKKLDPAYLKKIIRVTRVKAEAIVEIAKLVESFPSMNEIEKKPYDFIEFITSVKGVGRWTAEISIAKISKKFSVGPFTDLAVKRGFKKVLKVKTEEDMVGILKDFDEYIGLVLYLLAFEGHNRV